MNKKRFLLFLVFLAFLGFLVSCVDDSPPPGVILRVYTLDPFPPADMKIWLKINENELSPRIQKKMTDTLAAYFYLYRQVGYKMEKVDSTMKWLNRDELKEGTICHEFLQLIPGFYEIKIQIENSSYKGLFNIEQYFDVLSSEEIAKKRRG